MDKKKKAIIAVIILIVLLAILGVVWFFVFNNKNTTNSRETNNNREISEISKLYDTLQASTGFSFETILDDENHMYYAKSNNMAYIDTVSNGRETKNVIRDGNTYLLVDDSKSYYTYSNNQTNLNMITRRLEEIKDLECETGKERINNKNYSYEEYTALTEFAMGDFTENSSDVKTRFYFDGDELVYIKTIEGDKEEVLEVNISANVDQNTFQIPSDYNKA